VFAVVITGPPGAGKTSVLTALTDALSDDDIAHAAVEVETLVWTHPALSDEQWRRQLRLNCRLYRDAGHNLLLLAHTLETDDDVAELVAAVDADDTVLVRLEAQPQTLVERIIEREPESWSGLPGLVEHAQELAISMPDLAGVDVVLSTEGQRPEDVADRIRAALPVLVRHSDGGTLRT
jgi:GTPase SAR1 family protein